MGLVEETIEKIKELIVSGELGPGDRLPVENELATRLSVSRGSLREAVKTLTMLGILTVRRGSGTYVTRLEPMELLAVIGFVTDFLLDRQLSELLEARRVIEPAATALAAATITDAQLEELSSLVDAMAKADSIEALVYHDLQFHDLIVRATKNTVLTSVLRGIAAPTMRARVWHGMKSANAIEQTVAAHQPILDALQRRDPTLAFATALTHISSTSRWLEEFDPAPTESSLEEESVVIR
ncbi:MAG: GntR family transcriptional regulator, transcriptional repressor for pyruvate dehydrogenase complex [Kribbellaceae bacterium]|jgi:DNA-binding FadR family transcriptional regulator|nr:GntR family transcriptional regulator, transcriptional repressor for pyruvate dehydrogenase complex [Kribbellaceae bacterium]